MASTTPPYSPPHRPQLVQPESVMFNAYYTGSDQPLPWLDRTSLGGITPFLPNDVFEMIVDSIRDNKNFSTLATMARCSKATHALVARHLYHSLVLTTRNVTDVLYGIAGDGQELHLPAVDRKNPDCQYKIACLSLVREVAIMGEGVSMAVANWKRLVKGDGRPGAVLFPHAAILRLTAVALCPTNQMLMCCFSPRHVCLNVAFNEIAICPAFYHCTRLERHHLTCPGNTIVMFNPVLHWPLETLSIHGSLCGDLIYPLQHMFRTAVRIFRPVIPPNDTTFGTNVVSFPFGSKLNPPKTYEIISGYPERQAMVYLLNDKWDDRQYVPLLHKRKARPEFHKMANLGPKMTWTDLNDAQPCTVCGKK